MTVEKLEIKESRALLPQSQREIKETKAYPGYHPVQFDPEKFSLPCGWFDWWGPRSWCCAPLNPALRCCNGRCNPCLTTEVDALDPTIWKPTLDLPTPCPEEMQGVWWLCDNIAAETLVCFNDAKWTQLEDGYWRFQHDLPQTWSRDNSVFGTILAAVNSWRDTGCRKLNSPWVSVDFIFNFEKGVGKGDDTEDCWRINEDEWQKASWRARPGKPRADEPSFMYRWRRVIRADGTTTPAFEEMKQIMTSPYPHRNCLEPWCPLWPMCLTKEQRLKDMSYSNPRQLVIWRPEHRKPECFCAGLHCTCPFMCPCAKDVDGKYKEWKDEEAAAAADRPASKSPGQTVMA